MLTARIRAAEIRAERGRRIVAWRQIAVTHAGEARATVVKTAVEVGGVVGAPPKALSLITHRVKRRCQALVESDASLKTTVIGSGFLSAILTMKALLSAA
jgi:hypothetical protein